MIIGRYKPRPLLVLLATGVVASMGLFSFWQYASQDELAGLLCGAGTILFLAYIAYARTRKMPDMVMEIRPDGLRVVEIPYDRLIPWEEISSIRTETARGISFLVLDIAPSVHEALRNQVGRKRFYLPSTCKLKDGSLRLPFRHLGETADRIAQELKARSRCPVSIEETQDDSWSARKPDPSYLKTARLIAVAGLSILAVLTMDCFNGLDSVEWRTVVTDRRHEVVHGRYGTSNLYKVRLKGSRVSAMPRTSREMYERVRVGDPVLLVVSGKFRMIRALILEDGKDGFSDGWYRFMERLSLFSIGIAISLLAFPKPANYYESRLCRVSMVGSIPMLVFELLFLYRK